jgi:hypothetical protein
MIKSLPLIKPARIVDARQLKDKSLANLDKIPEPDDSLAQAIQSNVFKFRKEILQSQENRDFC